MRMTTILASRDWSDLYWLLFIGVGGLAKLGQWIRDRSAKSDSLPAKKGAKPAPARKPSSAPPARAFPQPKAPVAKPFPLMDRLETGLTQLTKPAFGPPPQATRSAERAADFSSRGLKSAARLTTPGTPARRRPDAGRTVGPTARATPVREDSPAPPGPRRSARKRRSREPRQAGAEAVAQIARVMQSRAPESDPPSVQEPDKLPGYGLNNLSIHELRRAIVLREVLDPPLALRKPDAGRW